MQLEYYSESLMEMDLFTGGRVILKRFLKEQGVMVWLEFIWLRIGSSGGSL
jgi:hypothetical protein